MQKFYSMNLTVIPDGWRLFSIRNADKKFLAFKQKIFERDGYTCRYCGIVSKLYQEVVNLDGNYRNNKAQNLVTACYFCFQCCFLEAVGNGNARGGMLIYLPELSQRDLNAICFALFSSIFNSTYHATGAQGIYENLKNRAEIIESRLGKDMSDPSLFGRLLLDMPNDSRKKIEQNIAPFIRLLPIYEKFTDVILELSGNFNKVIPEYLKKGV